jgi:hypothetical protein
VREGVRIGLFTATIYALVATAIILGSGMWGQISFAEYATLILSYFGAGVVGGGTAGAMKRYSNSLPGAALTGVAVGLSVFLALCTAAFGSPLAWDRHHWVAYGMGVVIVSPLIAIFYRYQIRD